MNKQLKQLAGTVDVHTNCVLPLLVCLIFGLSMAVIARPRTLLSACSCTSKHPTPGLSLCLSVSLPLSSSSPSDLLQCGRQLGGWVNRGGEESGKRRGWGRRRRRNYPSFFFFPCAHAQWSPPLPVTLFIAVHPPGVDGGGGFWGGSPTGRPERLTDAWF